jgi:hypothetical protein
VEGSQVEQLKYWIFGGKIQIKEGSGIYSLKMDWSHLSQGITEDIEAAKTSKSSIGICHEKFGSLCIICGWLYHFMKSYNFKLWESDVAAHFYGETARRLTAGNGQDQSVDGGICQVMAEVGSSGSSSQSPIEGQRESSLADDELDIGHPVQEWTSERLWKIMQKASMRWMDWCQIKQQH